MEMPETQYTRSGDVNIAFQIVGDGPVDLLWIPGSAQHLELAWEEPHRRAWLEALGAEYRVIVFDKRGTGLSDRVEGAPGIEERMDDCRAVLDAAGSQRAAVLTAGDASDLALVFAATYPERVHALTLWQGHYRERGHRTTRGRRRGRQRCARSRHSSEPGRPRSSIFSSTRRQASTTRSGRPSRA
jgi:pimeloyl-ACP methyl ester carboxylesterase